MQAASAEGGHRGRSDMGLPRPPRGPDWPASPATLLSLANAHHPAAPPVRTPSHRHRRALPLPPPPHAKGRGPDPGRGPAVARTMGSAEVPGRRGRGTWQGVSLVESAARALAHRSRGRRPGRSRSRGPGRAIDGIASPIDGPDRSRGGAMPRGSAAR